MTVRFFLSKLFAKSNSSILNTISSSNFGRRIIFCFSTTTTMSDNEAKNSIFMKIIRREIPSDIVFEDEKSIAIRDINPRAPVHVLVIPKEPIVSLSETSDQHVELLGHLMNNVRKVAEQEKLENGYRVVINNGNHGGQEVPHLHIHLLGGRQLGWPPG